MNVRQKNVVSFRRIPSFVYISFTFPELFNPLYPRLQRIRFLFYRHRIFITRSGWRQRQLRHKAQHPFENVIAVRRFRSPLGRFQYIEYDRKIRIFACLHQGDDGLGQIYCSNFSTVLASACALLHSQAILEDFLLDAITLYA